MCSLKDFLACLFLAALLCLGTVQCWYLSAGSEEGRSQDVNQELDVFYPSKHQVADISRNKRWDYGADGCHCNGYSVECMKDIFCQSKYRSPLWSCKVDCCGMRCVKTG